MPGTVLNRAYGIGAKESFSSLVSRAIAKFDVLPSLLVLSLDLFSAKNLS